MKKPIRSPRSPRTANKLTFSLMKLTSILVLLPMFYTFYLLQQLDVPANNQVVIYGETLLLDDKRKLDTRKKLHVQQTTTSMLKKVEDTTISSKDDKVFLKGSISSTFKLNPLKNLTSIESVGKVSEDYEIGEISNPIVLCDSEQISRIEFSNSSKLFYELSVSAPTKSLKTLFQAVQHRLSSEPAEYHGQEITKEMEKEEIDRCQRYGYQYDAKSRSKRRRVFLGSLVGDDTWHSIAAHAIEMYGLYHAVALVEGNKTFTGHDRCKRFQPGNINHLGLRSGIFGPDTNVTTGLYYGREGDNKLDPLYAENLQREVITQIWIQQGMTKDDIGIIADMDEFFTRDFMLAMQTCKVPQFQPEQTCKAPKVLPRTLIFESAPECLLATRFWFHPDAMLGECIDGIGDTSFHKPARRETFDGRETYRMNGFGNFFADYKNETRVDLIQYPPLWKPVDFRNVEGAYEQKIERLLHNKEGHTAYHFHNFFDSVDLIRKKYLTYGHPHSDANSLPIAKIYEDLDVAVRCVLNRPTEDLRTELKVMEGGLDSLDRIPIVFEKATGSYRVDRLEELKKMFLDDEKKFGVTIPVETESKVKAANNADLAAQLKATTTTKISAVEGTFLGNLRKEGSKTATVMAMATGYSLNVYKRFVGTLRKSGFEGSIILGVKGPLHKNIQKYFTEQRVTAKALQFVNCTFTKLSEEDKKKLGIHENERNTCAYPYSDIKIRWSRFPLLRDWLEECEECTGPVLVTDARDTFFQRDPFGVGSPEVTGLQVFQEHLSMKTENWLVQWPIKECKGLDFAKPPLLSPMLCSGTTIGTRDAMLKYLSAMYEEMKVWTQNPKCWFDLNGDDQSIHNYLFYTNQLSNAISIRNRMGIVNTVGVQGDKILRDHIKEWKKHGLEESESNLKPYFGAEGNRWLSTGFDLIDKDGFFLDFDGERSRVVHQFDRFGVPFDNSIQGPFRDFLGK